MVVVKFHPKSIIMAYYNDHSSWPTAIGLNCSTT